MPVNEASSEETPYGRYITSDGWFVLNIADALAVRNDEKGGATYPLEPRESPFRDVGIRVPSSRRANRTRSTTPKACRKGFSCSRASARSSWRRTNGRCGSGTTSTVQPVRASVIVGAGDGPCSILMLGARPDVEVRYPVSEVAAKYDASAVKDTDDADEAYADWPGEYVPVRLSWPPDTGTTG
jgi:hypothetical protein